MSEDTLFEFPCPFPIKAMGKNDVELDVLIIEIISRHAPDISPADLKARPSKDGNFLAITATIQAHSKQQLDAIYQDLTDHPLILFAL